MSEGKTLFAILIVSIICIYLIANIGATAALGSSSPDCVKLKNRLNSPAGQNENLFLLMIFDPCIRQHTWFTWIFLLPIITVGGLLVKKLGLI